MVLGGDGFTPLAETLIHVAARAEHVAVTLRPALAAGIVVVCDRFADSTMAYQGFGQGADRTQIAALARLPGLAPDLTIMLETSPATAHARRRARGLRADRYEAEDAAFHDRVAAGFRAIAEAEPARCVRVAADGDVAAVQAAVLDVVLARMETVLARMGAA